MSTLITLTRHVNHEKMLSRRFLTPKRRLKKIFSGHEAVVHHVSIYCLSVWTYVDLCLCALGVAVLCCGRFQYISTWAFMWF